MSWRGLLILGPLWTAFCAAISVNGWAEGAVVGGGFWLLIVLGRLWLEHTGDTP